MHPPKIRTIETYRALIQRTLPSIADAAGWDEEARERLLARIPTEDSNSGGFDPAIGICIGLGVSRGLEIPGLPALVTDLHVGRYSSENCRIVREGIEAQDANSPGVGWLAMASICTMYDEGAITPDRFMEQVEAAEKLMWPDHLAEVDRLAAANKEWDSWGAKYAMRNGIAYGTEDGCMQGAYFAGHPVAAQYASGYGLWFLGTCRPGALDALSEFPWSDQVDEQGRSCSGIIASVEGHPVFVKCATLEEFERVCAELA